MTCHMWRFSKCQIKWINLSHPPKKNTQTPYTFRWINNDPETGYSQELNWIFPSCFFLAGGRTLIDKFITKKNFVCKQKIQHAVQKKNTFDFFSILTDPFMLDVTKMAGIYFYLKLKIHKNRQTHIYTSRSLPWSMMINVLIKLMIVATI